MNSIHTKGIIIKTSHKFEFQIWLKYINFYLNTLVMFLFKNDDGVDIKQLARTLGGMGI